MRSKSLAFSALEHAQLEVIERASDVVPKRTATRSGQRDLNDCGLTDMRVPRASQSHHGAVGLYELRVRQILHGIATHRRALCEYAATHSLHARHALQPQRQIEQVHAEIHQATAAS